MVYYKKGKGKKIVEVRERYALMTKDEWIHSRELRHEAHLRNEKPITYFDMEDLKNFKAFLRKNNLLTKEELAELSLKKLRLFLKTHGKTSEHINPYQNLVPHYNIPASITKKEVYFYKDITKKNQIDFFAIVDMKFMLNHYEEYKRQNRLSI